MKTLKSWALNQKVECRERYARKYRHHHCMRQQAYIYQAQNEAEILSISLPGGAMKMKQRRSVGCGKPRHRVAAQKGIIYHIYHAKIKNLGLKAKFQREMKRKHESQRLNILNGIRNVYCVSYALRQIDKSNNGIKANKRERKLASAQ